MKNLDAFLNPKKVETRKVAISNRFIDPETGKPIEWEIGVISAKKTNELQDECTITKRINGKSETDFNTGKYMNLLVTHSVVYPELNNKELQDAYGVKGAENLLGVMLTGSELQRLQNAVNEINDFDKTFDELVSEAKN